MSAKHLLQITGERLGRMTLQLSALAAFSVYAFAKQVGGGDSLYKNSLEK